MIYFIGPELNWRRVCRMYSIDPRGDSVARRLITAEDAENVILGPEDRLLVVPDLRYAEPARIMRAKVEARRRRGIEPTGPLFPPAPRPDGDVA